MSDGFASCWLAFVTGLTMYGTGAPAWAGVGVVIICLLLFWIAVLIRDIKHIHESEVTKKKPDFYTADSKQEMVEKLESLGYQRLK